MTKHLHRVQRYGVCVVKNQISNNTCDVFVVEAIVNRLEIGRLFSEKLFLSFLY